MQHIAEWAVNVAVVSEPYWIPTNRENWASDRLGLVAIIVSGGLQLEKKVKGDGYVITKCGEILLVGIYCPPNATAATLEASLDRLSADLQRFTLPTLICGDFNAKSPAWGSRVSDVRGDIIVLEWATALGLAILNRGTVPTCVRPQGKSRVDITFASPAVASRVSGWTVRAEAESLSEHRYITFQVADTHRTAAPNPFASTALFPRWRVKCLDRDMAQEAALVKAWLPVPEGPIDVNDESTWMIPQCLPASRL